MEQTEDKPNTDPQPGPQEKSTAPNLANGFSAREAARLWGTWSDGRPYDGARYKPPYAIL
jgi:hypothetical protein